MNYTYLGYGRQIGYDTTKVDAKIKDKTWMFKVTDT